MKISPFVYALSIAALALCLATSAFSQSTFGTILGTVTDASGAVMPNVVIKITNQGENTSRDVRSDAQGNYQAENLKEGLYTISVQAAGFSRGNGKGHPVDGAANRARRPETGGRSDD